MAVAQSPSYYTTSWWLRQRSEGLVDKWEFIWYILLSVKIGWPYPPERLVCTVSVSLFNEVEPSDSIAERLGAMGIEDTATILGFKGSFPPLYQTNSAHFEGKGTLLMTDDGRLIIHLDSGIGSSEVLFSDPEIRKRVVSVIRRATRFSGSDIRVHWMDGVIEVQFTADPDTAGYAVGVQEALDCLEAIAT